jgi:hypothetical protein
MRARPVVAVAKPNFPRVDRPGPVNALARKSARARA